MWASMTPLLLIFLRVFRVPVERIARRNRMESETYVDTALHLSTFCVLPIDDWRL